MQGEEAEADNARGVEPDVRQCFSSVSEVILLVWHWLFQQSVRWLDSHHCLSWEEQKLTAASEDLEEGENVLYGQADDGSYKVETGQSCWEEPLEFQEAKWRRPREEGGHSEPG